MQDGIQKKEELPDVFMSPELNVFAATRFRGGHRRFGIKLDDRRRHMYVIGKTGMGKTTMLENMMLNDIYAGHGIAIIDPHGDSAEKIIDYIPSHRLNDVVYFNPADMAYPFGFNILENVNPDHKHLIVAGLMGVFKKIWPDVWSARMEYILNNTLLALLDYPGSTLLGVNRLLADRSYRKKVIGKIRDPIVKSFWTDEFAKYNERYQQEAIAPIQNKVGQFLSASIMRNIVAQVKSTINIREIMDTRKILVMNLSKGRIGEDNSRLLGGMLITKIQLSAMERVDTPEHERKDFFLYVDEFQNFATESFAHILSEARKYRLSLIMAHQFVEQLEEEVAAAVFGNVGTLCCFRIGSRDAEGFAKEFDPEFTEQDLVKLEKFNIYLKLMVDGIATLPFSATTLPPIAQCMQSTEKIIRISRERYGVTRQSIEEKIMKWSGMEVAGSPQEDQEEESSGSGVTSSPPPRPAPASRPQLVSTASGGGHNSGGGQKKKKPARASSGGGGGGDVVRREASKEKDGAAQARKDSMPKTTTPEQHGGTATLNLMQLAQRSAGQEENRTEPKTEYKHAALSAVNLQSGPGVATQIQETSASQNVEAPAGDSGASGEAPKKKKRKRKRKKKKPDSADGNNPHNPIAATEPLVVDTASAGEISLSALKEE